MHFLVNAFKESLQNELVKELYKEEMMLDLMKETPDVASRRKACREMKELLREEGWKSSMKLGTLHLCERERNAVQHQHIQQHN